MICDLCPAATLAAVERMPVIAVGSGFSLPPPGQELFPPLGCEADTAPRARTILEVVTAVQRRRSRAAPARLPALMGGDAHFVCATDLLDPHRALRPGPNVGPLLPRSPVTERGEGYLAYLGQGWPGLEVALRSLSASGLPGAIYVRNAAAVTRRLVAELGLSLLEHPAAIDPACYRLVVHHGGKETSEMALLAGRAQVLMPCFQEQELNAAALVRAGVGALVVGKVSVEDLTSCLRTLASDGSHAGRARQLALELGPRHSRGSLEGVVGACRALVA
jgi:rhamnosyltransferase subunit B